MKPAILNLWHMHSKGRSCPTTLAERRSAVDAALVVVEQLSVCFMAVSAAVYQL